MTVDLVELDAISEMLALSSHANTKNLIITAVGTHGPIERDALTQAIQIAAREFPQIRSVICEVRKGGRFRLFRQFRPDLQLPLRCSDASDCVELPTSLDKLICAASARLDHEWNLFGEAPVDFHLVKLGPDHHIFAPVVHHVAGDAGMASELGREVLRQYHIIVKGEEPAWAQTEFALSTARKRLVRTRRAKWTDYVSEARHAVVQLFEKPTLPVGSGDSKDSRQHQVKRVLPEDVTEKLARPSIGGNAALVDLLAAAANIAIDRWNLDRGVQPGRITTSVSVNMKGRYQGMDSPNNSALLFFGSEPGERANFPLFTRSLAAARIRQFRSQRDFKFFKDVNRLNAAVGLLPLEMRRRLVHYLMTKHQYSVAITLLGVVWPSLKNGRPTADSNLTYTGDATIEEVHGTGYKLLSSTPVLFIVYAYRRRLNVVLAASAALFTRQEADAFADLVMDLLVSAATG